MNQLDLAVNPKQIDSAALTLETVWSDHESSRSDNLSGTEELLVDDWIGDDALDLKKQSVSQSSDDTLSESCLSNDNDIGAEQMKNQYLYDETLSESSIADEAALTLDTKPTKQNESESCTETLSDSSTTNKSESHQESLPKYQVPPTSFNTTDPILSDLYTISSIFFSEHAEHAFQQALSHLSQNRLKEAISFFEDASDAGHSLASFNLGVLFDPRTSKKHKNLHRSLECYKRAAHAGHPRAQYRLSRLMLEVVDADNTSVFDEAVMWLRKACNGGCDDASRLLMQLEMFGAV